MREKEEERDGIGGGGRNGHHNGNNLDHAETETIATGAFREGLTNTRHIEKVYLTGVYRDKYRWVSNHCRHVYAFALEVYNEKKNRCSIWSLFWVPLRVIFKCTPY